jgi:two-component system CheB/CheR fusion protein
MTPKRKRARLDASSCTSRAGATVVKKDKHASPPGADAQASDEASQAINAELNAKNDALMRANSDIRNLFDSTGIAAMFLDESLCIRSYTPAMTDLFHLHDDDKGKPITGVSSLVGYSQLVADSRDVLRNLGTIERLLHVDRDARTFLLRMRPYLTVDNVVDGVVLTFVDVTDAQRQNLEHARLAAIVNSSRDAIFGFSLDDTITSWNPSAERLFGLPSAQIIGQPLASLLPPEAPDAARKFFSSHAREHRLAGFEMTWVRPDGQPVPLEFSYSPVRDDSGALIAGKLIARDISERHRANRHTEMMLGELNHRVKNTLASVQAIALQTLASAPTLADFRESFVARLLALSNTHNLLARDGWNGADIADIVNTELAPYQRDGPERVTLSGAKFELDVKTALALSMAIHELATNAGKYGALSRRRGRVAVSWETRDHDGRPWLHLTWIERGGPAVKPPTRRGFGSRLITEGVAYELDARVTLEYPDTGVTCIFDVPLGGRE